MSKRKPKRPLCSDGTLAHHWLVGPPSYHYIGSIANGRLMEDTHWACTLCPCERDNTVEVFLDDDD